MKVERWTSIVLAIAVGILLWMQFGEPAKKDVYGQRCDLRSLKLVAKYEPLHLYIYADTTSTNKFPDFMVREGDIPIYLRETESNKVVITHAEKNLDYFMTEKYDNSGNLLRRDVNSGGMKYAYIDTNGDGLFDVFINYSEHGKRPAVFTRSNLCWIPLQLKLKGQTNSQLQ